VANASDHDQLNISFDRYVVPEIEVLTRVALSITRNHSDASDLVQETLLNAYKGLGNFDGLYPRAWLFTIMRNTQIKRYRKRRPSLITKEELEAFENSKNPSHSGGSAEDAFLASQFGEEVLTGLNALVPAQRLVIELIDVVGLSYGEAAEALGIPQGTVMSRLHRGRSSIRQHLSDAGLAPKRGLR
ncbi:unnamed protein product, partial [Acidithrix sp. C25]